MAKKRRNPFALSNKLYKRAKKAALSAGVPLGTYVRRHGLDKVEAGIRARYKKPSLPEPKRTKTKKVRRGPTYVGRTVILGSRCEAITRAGRRCSRDATVLFASKIRFCVQHEREYEARSLEGRLIVQVKPAPGTRKTSKRSTVKEKRAKGYGKRKRRPKRSRNPQRPKDSLQKVDQAHDRDRAWRGYRL